MYTHLTKNGKHKPSRADVLRWVPQCTGDLRIFVQKNKVKQCTTY